MKFLRTKKLQTVFFFIKAKDKYVTEVHTLYLATYIGSTLITKRIAEIKNYFVPTCCLLRNKRVGM